MGEGIPYALVRSNGVLSGAAKKIKRSVSQTIRDQVHITTRGYFSRPPFECAVEVPGLNRILYSVDYPFSPNTRGKDFFASLNLTEADMPALTHGNAEKLLRL